MAMTTCKECGGKVSTQATSCPHCGAVLQATKKKTSLAAGCAAVFLVPVVLVFVIALTFGPTQQAPSSGNSASTPQPPAERVIWQVLQGVSEIDDGPRVQVAAESEVSFVDRFGRAQRPQLTFRCSEGKTDAFIMWGTFISTSAVPVLTRIDAGEAQTLDWTQATDFQGTFHPSPVAFARQLMPASTLLVQVTPHGESRISARFDLTGLTEALRPLREACSW